jgi:hypothetical protein
VDGIDNGVNQYESDQPARYTDNTGLSSRVGKLNPAWNESFAPERQGLTLVHFSAQLERFVWYRGCAWRLCSPC